MRGFEPHSWHFLTKLFSLCFFPIFLLVLTIIYSNPIQCMSFFLCTHDNSPRTSHDHRHHRLKHTPAISNIFLDAIDDGLVFHFFKKESIPIMILIRQINNRFDSRLNDHFCTIITGKQWDINLYCFLSTTLFVYCTVLCRTRIQIQYCVHFSVTNIL